MSSMPASRATSAYGSRPTSPYVNRDNIRREKELLHINQQYGIQTPQYGYSKQQDSQQYESDIY